MDRETLMATLSNYYRALGHGDRDSVRACVTPGFRHNLAGVEEGFDPWWKVVDGLRRGFGTLDHTIDEVLADCVPAGGMRCAVRMLTGGTHCGVFLGHPPSGRRFHCAGMEFLRLDGGLVAERWGVFDTIAMLHQLGLYAAHGARA